MEVREIGKDDKCYDLPKLMAMRTCLMQRAVQAVRELSAW